MTTEQAEISQGRKISGIWFIPLLALVLGLYMVVHNWMTQGPEIKIAFTTASGLEQGKTKVKYRNVDMGMVEEVRLNDALDGVIAKVKLDRQALPRPSFQHRRASVFIRRRPTAGPSEDRTRRRNTFVRPQTLQ